MTPAQVLVVEDERIVALHLRQQLEKLGYRVPGMAASGAQALRQIEASRPDVILMDINIEGPIDGIETASRIPADHHIPMIYLTAYSEDATLDRARETRPYGYLLKPFSERELHATIQMTLERSRNEAALRASEAMLRQRQKMEAIGQLAGGVAHDFNNLLGIIIGNLEFIAEHADANAELSELVHDALDAALRSVTLTRKLLVYSRRQPLIPRVLSVDKLVENLLDLIKRSLGETIAIQLRMQAGLWTIRVDPDQLDTALINLAVNARDAMPDGGTLTIEASNVVLDASHTERHVDVAPGDYVVLAVSDNGSGMSRDVADRALEPFYTTKLLGKGTGLGLSMVYGFVRQSSGHVVISSEIGRGTTVRLYFPAVGALPDSPLPAANLNTIAVARRGEVILVVEDDPAVRKFVVSLVTSLGYEVLEAAAAVEAYGVLDRAARVDLLLTDVMLPHGTNGPELARQAQARRPALKLLFMSGFAGNASAGNGPPAQAVPLLTKPFRRDELARKLRQLLDSEG